MVGENIFKKLKQGPCGWSSKSENMIAGLGWQK